MRGSPDRRIRMQSYVGINYINGLIFGGPNAQTTTRLTVGNKVDSAQKYQLRSTVRLRVMTSSATADCVARRLWLVV